ncbi:hypothetical protein PHAVU_006G086211 [Phaseolus vulgaris]
MGETEQAGQTQTTMETSLKTRNGEQNATLVRTHKDDAEGKRATPEQRAGISISLSISSKEAEATGKHEPRISISRVEDSLLQTSEREVIHLPRHLGSNSGKIRNPFLPFGEQKERGDHSIAEGSSNSIKVFNDSVSICSSSTSERRVFWVGDTSKNNKREDRKYVLRKRGGKHQFA